MSQRRSIRSKLVRAVMTTTLVALLVSIAIIIVYDLRSYHRSLMSDLATQAELVGHMSSAALSFHDPRLAKENLALLRTPEGAVAEASGVQAAAAEGESQPDPHLLLYVEDNPANLRLVEEIVRFRPDLRLLSALDGHRGLSLARAHQPEIILMDLNLPGMSGIEVLRQLRADPLTAHIPVIALTANAMPRDIERGLAAGFIRYLTKPIDIDKFTEAINSTLARLHAKEAVPAERKAE